LIDTRQIRTPTRCLESSEHSTIQDAKRSERIAKNAAADRLIGSASRKKIFLFWHESHFFCSANKVEKIGV
jgi:hypothetical protein